MAMRRYGSCAGWAFVRRAVLACEGMLLCGGRRPARFRWPWGPAAMAREGRRRPDMVYSGLGLGRHLYACPHEHRGQGGGPILLSPSTLLMGKLNTVIRILRLLPDVSCSFALSYFQLAIWNQKLIACCHFKNGRWRSISCCI